MRMWKKVDWGCLPIDLVWRWFCDRVSREICATANHYNSITPGPGYPMLLGHLCKYRGFAWNRVHIENMN